MELKYKQFKTTTESDDTERTITAVISTSAVDRDREVLMPDGAEFESYLKNPVVLWAHQHFDLPIGRTLWIKADKKKITAKAQFAKTPLAEQIYQMYKDGYLSAFSVGFNPLSWREPTEQERKRAGWKDVRTVYDKWELLEFSAVPVPSNPEALAVAVKSKQIHLDDKLLKSLGLDEESDDAVQYVAIPQHKADEVKRVIPYRQTPKSPENTPWDGPAEVKKADIDDLKIMCAWYDAENPDVKSSYKLPHHKAGGSHPVVWNGVRAAMAALLGARGGVDIPASDRRGVYNHLVKHYKEFDKEPPEFKDVFEVKPKAIDVRPAEIKVRPVIDLNACIERVKLRMKGVVFEPEQSV